MAPVTVTSDVRPRQAARDKMSPNQQKNMTNPTAVAAATVVVLTGVCGGLWVSRSANDLEPQRLPVHGGSGVSSGAGNVGAVRRGSGSRFGTNGLDHLSAGEPDSPASPFAMVLASAVPDLRLFRSSRFRVHVAELEPLWDSACGDNLQDYIDQTPAVSSTGTSAGIRSHSAYSSKFMAEIALPIEAARSRFSVDTSAEADMVLVGFCVMARGKQGSAIATVIDRIKRSPSLAQIWATRRRDIIAVVTSDHGPCANFRESLNRDVG